MSTKLRCGLNAAEGLCCLTTGVAATRRQPPLVTGGNSSQPFYHRRRPFTSTVGGSSFKKGVGEGIRSVSGGRGRDGGSSHRSGGSQFGGGGVGGGSSLYQQKISSASMRCLQLNRELLLSDNGTDDEIDDEENAEFVALGGNLPSRQPHSPRPPTPPMKVPLRVGEFVDDARDPLSSSPLAAPSPAFPLSPLAENKPLKGIFLNTFNRRRQNNDEEEEKRVCSEGNKTAKPFAAKKKAHFATFDSNSASLLLKNDGGASAQPNGSEGLGEGLVGYPRLPPPSPQMPQWVATSSGSSFADTPLSPPSACDASSLPAVVKRNTSPLSSSSSLSPPQPQPTKAARPPPLSAVNNPSSAPSSPLPASSPLPPIRARVLIAFFELCREHQAYFRSRGEALVTTAEQRLLLIQLLEEEAADTVAREGSSGGGGGGKSAPACDLLFDTRERLRGSASAEENEWAVEENTASKSNSVGDGDGNACRDGAASAALSSQAGGGDSPHTAAALPMAALPTRRKRQLRFDPLRQQNTVGGDADEEQQPATTATKIAAPTASSHHHHHHGAENVNAAVICRHSFVARYMKAVNASRVHALQSLAHKRFDVAMLLFNGQERSCLHSVVVRFFNILKIQYLHSEQGKKLGPQRVQDESVFAATAATNNSNSASPFASQGLLSPAPSSVPPPLPITFSKSEVDVVIDLLLHAEREVLDDDGGNDNNNGGGVCEGEEDDAAERPPQPLTVTTTAEKTLAPPTPFYTVTRQQLARQLTLLAISRCSPADYALLPLATSRHGNAAPNTLIKGDDNGGGRNRLLSPPPLRPAMMSALERCFRTSERF